jgi:transposase InsO family protein
MNPWRARCGDNSHGGFGGRARETDQWKHRNRARVRPYTYLSCGEGEMFLCAIRDGHSRKVLGYSIADHISAEMVADAIAGAVAARHRRCRGTILHSDRGGEYTAHLTAKACSRY